jgi:hypothetical protein
METFTIGTPIGSEITDPNVLLKFTSSSPTTSTGTATGLWVHPHANLLSSGGGTSTGTTYPSAVIRPSIPDNTVSFSAPVSFSNPINFTQATSKQIMQNKVAVFKVTRDKDERITNAEFIKELWVETKNGQSVDFQVARDKDLADYEMSDLSIRTIYTVTF